MSRILLVLSSIILFVGPLAFARAQAVPSGVYTLTLSPAGGDDASCGHIQGRESVIVKEGAVSSSFITRLRLTLAPDGAVSGTGFEQMTGWGAPVTLTGKQTSTGFQGTLQAERFAHFCYGNWSLAKPSTADAGGTKTGGDAASDGTGKEDMQSRLKRLKQLFDDGLITKEEYEAKRKQILDAL